MRKPMYFPFFVYILIAYSAVNAEQLCSTELFPDETISKLSWQEEDQSFVVGLGEQLGNEYNYEYKLINYDNNIIHISNYDILENSIISDLLRALRISDQFYDSYDSTHLFLSPDYQNALYLQENQLGIFNIETGTINNVMLSSPVSEIEQVNWIDDETFLLIATPPYGIGYEIIKGCFYQNCIRYLTNSLNEPIGFPAISIDNHFAIAPNLIDPSILFLIDLTQDDGSTYEEIPVPFVTQTDVSPVWSGNRNEVYVIGSEATTSDVTNSIYKLLFRGETLLEATQVSELDNDLADSTSLWLVDPINQLSIHALRNGSLNIFCWN